MSEHEELDDYGPTFVTHFFKQFDRMMSSHTASNVLIIILMILAAIPILGIDYYATRRSSSAPTAQMAATGVSKGEVLYRCAGGRSIRAEYSSENVTLYLSDGRQLSLPRNGSNARYSNPDDSFVFTPGSSAYITENGVRTYDVCVQGS